MPMRTSILRLAALASALAAGACAGPAPEAIVEGDLGRRLDEVAAAWAGGRFWGAVLVEIEGRVVLAKGYGMADFASRPNGPDTLYDVGSISKQFAAAALLALEEEGRLSLDDPIGKYFPDAPADKRAITLLHLVRHESGLPQGEVGGAILGMEDRDPAAAKILALPLAFEPGQGFSYSNVGYFLLAAVVEKVSRRSFEAYLKERLFRRAGLPSTGFIRDAELDRGLGSTRRSSGTDAHVLDYFWTWSDRGATGVVTTLRDLLLWRKALVSGKVLGKEALAKFFAPGPHGYALGWFVDENAWGIRRVSHSGETRGYQTRLSILDGGRVAIAAATGDFGEVGVFVDRLEAVAFGPGPLDAEAARALAGVWRLPGGDAFDVEFERGLLSVRSEGPEATARILFGAALAPDQAAVFSEMGREAAARFRSVASGGDPSAFFAQGKAKEAGLFRARWAACTREFGAFREAADVGSFFSPKGATFVRARFEKGAAVFRAEWDWASRKFTEIEPVPLEFPFQAVLCPLSTTEYVGRPMAGPGLLRIRASREATGRIEELTWEDRTAGEAARIVCVRPPRPR